MSRATPDVSLGNLPTDTDYDYCQRAGIMTIESQQRNATALDRRDMQRNDNSWFQMSGALTGD